LTENNKVSKLTHIIIFLKDMISKKFTGRIEIIFNQGGIRGIQKTKTENVDL
jgi:hypothetical protein